MGEATEGSTRDRLGLWLGIALVLGSTLLLEGVGTYAFHSDAGVRILGTLTVGALLLMWMLAAIARPTFRPRTALAGPLVLAMLAFGVSVLGSQRPRLSLEPALIGVASGLTLLMLTSLLRNATIRRLVAVMVMLLPVVISLLYMGAVLIEWIRWWTLVGHLSAPPLRPSFIDLSLGSPNVVAAYLIIFAPLSAALAARRFGVRVAIVVLIMAGITVFLTGSRSGYAGAAVAVLVGTLMGRARIVATARAALGRLRGRRPRPVLVAIAGAAIAVAVLVGPGLAARLTLAGADYRSWFWRSALELFDSSPLTGTGPGTWAQLKLATVLPTEINAVVPHAHSLFFQTISEVGVLGLVGVIIFAAAVARRGRQVHHGADRWTRIEVLASVAGLTGLLGQQGTDYLMNVPAVALGAGLLIAWIDGAAEGVSHDADQHARRSASLSKPAAFVLGAILVAAVPTLVRVAGAMVAAERGNLTAASGDWTGALDGYERAIAGDPDFTLYRIERANALAHLGRLVEARDAYSAVVNLDLLPQNVIALATLELETGDPARAAELARVALKRGPNDTLVELNAGRILEAAGQAGAAVDAYAAAITNDLALASSTWWHGDGRTIMLDSIVTKARSALLAKGDVPTAAIISAYAGRMDEARQDVDALVDPDQRSFLSAIVEGIGGDRTAGIAALRARVVSAPGDFQTLVWLVRVLRGAGDPTAEAFAERAGILRQDEAGIALEVLSVIPAVNSDRWLGAVAGYPFAIYSRKGPLDAWPPQVLVIGIVKPS